MSGQNTGSTSISVSWKAVQADLQNGIITGYNITYQSQTENDNGFVEAGPNDRQAHLTGLKEFVVYNISVVAFTVKGNGPPSLIVVRTDQDSKWNNLPVVFLYVMLAYNHYSSRFLSHYNIELKKWRDHDFMNISTQSSALLHFRIWERSSYIVNVFHWCVWTQFDRLLIVTIFPLKLNSNPSPDFSVNRVLSGIKVLTRVWILTTFEKKGELIETKSFWDF